MAISRVKDLAEESHNILAWNYFASGYVLHEDTSEFSSALILKADEFIDWNLDISLIGKSLHHGSKCLILTFSVRNNVEDGWLNCCAKILEGFVKGLA